MSKECGHPAEFRQRDTFSNMAGQTTREVCNKCQLVISISSKDKA